jgi:cytosine/creatinine deaminase
MELVVRHAALPDGQRDVDIGVEAGRIAAVQPQFAARGREEIDAGGKLVTPPFVDAHFHMDATLSYGRPRVNRSGTLLDGIALWGELKPLLTQEALMETGAAILRLGGDARPVGDPFPCGHLRRTPVGRRSAARGQTAGRTLS